MNLLIQFFTSAAGLIAALAALITAVASFIKALKDLRKDNDVRQAKIKEPQSDKGKKQLSVVARLLKMPLFILGIFLISVSGGIFAARQIFSPPPTIEITVPVNEGEIEVYQREGAGPGSFTVKGTSSEVYSNSKLRIYVLVHPAHPFAAGWWIQPSVTIDQNGEWVTEAWIGNNEYPPHRGDKVDVLAVISHPAYAGNHSHISDPKDIRPVSQSDMITVSIGSLRTQR